MGIFFRLIFLLCLINANILHLTDSRSTEVRHASFTIVMSAEKVRRKNWFHCQTMSDQWTGFFFCHLDWTNNCTKCDGFFPSGSLIADKKNEKKAATICEASLSAECTHLEMSTNGKSDDDPLPSRIRPEMNKNCFCDECEFFVMFFNGPVTDYRETCTNFYLRITIMKDNSMFVCVNI